MFEHNHTHRKRKIEGGKHNMFASEWEGVGVGGGDRGIHFMPGRVGTGNE